MRITKLASALAVVGLATISGAAFATNGYFSHGYGMKAKGMGGAATAVTGDTFGGANNPATMVWAGDRLDVGVDWFSPIRAAERAGSTTGLSSSADSDSNHFQIPEFGFNKMLNSNLSLGVTVYGNGGMNTNYPDGVLSSATCGAFPGGTTTNSNMLCGTGRLGVDLSQLIVAPTLAYKINPNHSIGISPLFGYQRFKAEGLSAFSSLSSDSTNLTNRGYDNAHGWGVRVGYFGQMNEGYSVGVSYATKINMSKLDKYKGLFAEQGDFDIPANFNAGFAGKLTPNLLVAVDFQYIAYSKVNSVGNPSTNAVSLGSNDGRGFGWDDVRVVKLGLEHKYSNNMTLRGGLSFANNPIQGRDVTFNILAPAVIENHATLGMTYNFGKTSELTVSYMHGFSNSVSGTSLFTALGANGGTEKIEMYQNSLGVSYGMKF